MTKLKIIFLAIVCFLLFGIHNAFAFTEEVDLNFNTSGLDFSSYADNTLTHTFHPNVSNISKIEFFCYGAITGGTFNIFIYEGNPELGGTYVGSDQYIGNCSASGDWLTFEWPSLLYIDPDAPHYWRIESLSNFWPVGTNVYPPYPNSIIWNGDYPIGSYGLWKSYYSLEDELEYGVEIIDIPDWGGTVEIGEEEDLVYTPNNTCIIGEECLFEFGYGWESVDKEVYLIDFMEDFYIPGYETASTTLVHKTVLRDTLHLTDTDPGIIQVDTYVLLLWDPDTETGKLYDDITVIWQQPDEYFARLFEDYECASICDEIATSTEDTFFDGVRYGVECGFRKIICWSFVPSENSVVKFGKAYYQIENSFPFSIYTQIEKAVQSTKLSTSTPTYYLDDLFPDYTGGTDMPILFEGIMDNGLKEEVWSKIYSGMELFVYLSAFGYFIMRILSISRKDNKSVEE